MRPTIIFFFTAFSIFSCGKKVVVSNVLATSISPTIDTVAKNEVKGIDSVAKKIIEPLKIDDAELKLAPDDLNFNFLKAKSKIVWKTKQNQDTYTVDIRMKKDSLIWVNISQSGFTGATGLFSKNKVQLYQKINGEYFNLTYDRNKHFKTWASGHSQITFFRTTSFDQLTVRQQTKGHS